MKKIIFPLRMNMKRDAVLDLQTAFLALKYYIDPKELADKRFGKTTHEAVRRFQKENQLLVDGIVGELTASTLNDVIKRIQEQAFEIEGTVQDRTGQPLKGLRILAADKDPSGEYPLGHAAYTDDKGHFEINYKEEDFKNGDEGVEDGPDVVVRAFDEKGELVAQSQPYHNLKKKIKINLIAENEYNNGNNNKEPLSVSGKIVLADNTPVAGQTVVAYDKTVGNEVAIGKAVTDKDGNYVITYTKEQLTDPAKDTADLIVKVTGDNREEVSSPLILKAKPAQEVIISLSKENYRGHSTFDEIHSKTQSLLANAELEKLSTEDIAIVGSKIGISPKQVAHYVKAQILERKTEINADVYFAWFENKLPTNLTNLASQDDEVLYKALNDAANRNVINIKDQKSFDKLVKRLKEQSIFITFNDNQEEGSLKSLLNVSGLNEEDQQLFISQYVKNNRPLPEFWESLKKGNLGSDKTEQLQFTLQLGALSLNNVSLVQVIQKQQIFKTFRDLAQLEKEDWKKIIKENGVKVPSGIPGEKDDQKLDTYVEAITRRIEEAHPTTVIAAKWEKSPNTNGQFSTFFKNNKTFELKNTSVRRYLKENPNALDGIEDKEEFVENLKAFERLYKLSPQYQKFDTIAPLYEKKLHSATAISMKSEHQFVKDFSQVMGGEKNAKKVYRNAKHLSNLSLITLAKYGKQFNSLGTNVFKAATYKEAENIESLPDLESLFGSLDFCNCKHCRSVLGPAAYLVDLLMYLNTAKDNVGNTALEKLFERRPDIGNIKLNCENTNTPLPYIDLVNEVLENAIIPIAYVDQDIDGTTVKIGEVPQTTAKAEALLANPEHIKIEAYKHLLYSNPDDETSAPISYPWILPFNLWAEEARVHLDHFKVPRHLLMEQLLPSNATEPEKQAIKLATATEYLQIIPEERNLITIQENNASTLKKHWGLKAGDNLIDYLRNVKNFNEQAKIKYDELDALLQTRFINPQNAANKLAVEFASAESCELDKATIQNLDIAALDRFHRFIRLQRKTGWSATQLDRIIQAFGGSITEDVILNIAWLKKVQELAPKASVGMLLSWYTNLETYTYPKERILDKKEADSLYDKLFLNKAINNPLEPIEDIFKLNANRTELEDTSRHMLNGDSLNEALSAYLLAATNLKAEDLLLLIEEELPDDVLNLANISHLYRIASFAKTFKLKIPQYLALKELNNTKVPLTEYDVDAANWKQSNPYLTVKFLEDYEKIKQHKYKIEELDYLLRHQFDNSNNIPPSDQSTGILLDQVRTAINQTKQSFKVEGQDPQEFLRKAISLILSDVTLIEEALAIISETSSKSADNQKQFIDDHFAIFIDATSAKEELVDPNNLTGDVEARISFISTPLEAYINNEILPGVINDVVSQQFAGATGVASQIALALLTSYLNYPKETTTKLIDLYTDSAFLDSEAEVTISNFPSQFEGHELFYKVAYLFKKLGATEKDLMLLFETAPLSELPYLSKLPTDAAEPSVSFTDWLRLTDLFKLHRRYNSDLFSILSLMEEAHAFDPADGIPANDVKEDILLELSDNTGWSFENLNFLVSNNGFNLQFPDDFRKAHWLIKIAEVMEHVKVIGASAEQIWSWNTASISFDQALAIKNATKAKYDEEEWLKVAPTIKDKLREKQRDALQGYLLSTRDEFETAEDMYSYYLIDTDTNSPVITSRIKQAISSTQLFVQRVMLNLEQEAPAFAAEDLKEWKWRKNYRVWEANRKVFLYPENWIEPDLRDNKTPFFKELENELLQAEITDTNVERSYLNYLEKLDQVARLEVAGLYYEEEIDTWHVLARTFAQPHIYFYRKWEKAYSWTAWEKIDIDIEGNFVAPVIYNRRLHLFWAVINEKTQKPSPDDVKVDSSKTEQKPKEPKKYYEVQLAWTEKKDNKWQPKKLSVAMATTTATTESSLPDPSTFYLETSFLTNGDLRVDVVTHGTAARKSFQFSGCASEPTLVNSYSSLSYKVPEASRHFMKFKKNGNFKMYKKVSTVIEDGDLYGYDDAYVYFVPEEEKILNKSNGDFKVNLPHQYSTFESQAPFFYEDKLRSFFIVPTDRYNSYLQVDKPTGPILDLELDDFDYRIPLDPIPDPGWIDPVDPYIFADNIFSKVNEAINGPILGPLAATGPAAIDANPLYNTSQPFTDAQPLTINQPLGGFTNGHARVSNLIPTLEGNSGAPAMAMATASATASNTTAEAINAKGYNYSIYLDTNSYLVTKENTGWKAVEDILVDQTTIKPALKWVGKKYHFFSFYHPFTCLCIKQLNRYGIEGLLNPDTDTPEGRMLYRQLTPDASFNFDITYDPENLTVNKDYPKESFDFSETGAYSLYNWELFFHVPITIATKLTQNQRFEEAMKWFHYIFDPTETNGDAPKRFWKIKPFYEFDEESNLVDLMKLLNEGDANLEKDVEAWEQDPFNPHLVARMRMVSYMKYTVMKYLDNLIAWGDHLFKRDTIESINEATQLYVMAGQILGKKPELVDKHIDAQEQTFNSLLPNIDKFSNAKVALENEITYTGSMNGSAGSLGESSTLQSILYFGIPHNEKLLTYWDTVADRLYKIRNSMNIEGIKRTLALFEPPIDPGMLVRAAAAGIDIASALGDLYAPLPHYRFQYMLQRAKEFSNDVKSLGSALLSALEKKDAEELALLRAGYQVQSLKDMKILKQKAIDEAEENTASLEKAKELAEERRNYYSSREYLNQHEKQNLDKLESAVILQSIGQGIEILAGSLALIPQFDAGVAGAFGSPQVKVEFGGVNVSTAVQVASRVLSLLSAIENHQANKAGILGSFDRRMDDFELQSTLAKIETEQNEKQIAASQIRLAMAQKELENHERQIQNAEEEELFLKDKFTNKELYGWMVSQLSGLYFQAYQMAYDISKQAERALQHELGNYSTNFIKFGYWDGLKKGLLAGEKLYNDLKQMEIAYMDQHKREHELNKHISLRILNPTKIVELQETGSCEFDIPEAIFDLDHPGHYFRRIKSVSLTIPCIAGPYTNISARMILLSNRVRVKTDTGAGYAFDPETDPDSDRFRFNTGGIQSVAVSKANNDSGLFELNFRDERFLPFENAGVVSRWRIELPTEFRQFDYRTITDLIMQVNYTARDGGDTFRTAVNNHLKSAINHWINEIAEEDNGLYQLISLKHEFGTAWHSFMHPEATADKHEVTLTTSDRHFPYFVRREGLSLQNVRFIVKLKPDEEQTHAVGMIVQLAKDGVDLLAPGGGATDLAQDSEVGNLASQQFDSADSPFASWTLRIDQDNIPNDIRITHSIDGADFHRLDPDKVEDVMLLFNYMVEE